MVTKAKQLAQDILEALPEFSKYAAEEAKIWEGHGKTKIYFGKKSITIKDDGSVDVGSNPYGISQLIDSLNS